MALPVISVGDCSVPAASPAQRPTAPVFARSLLPAGYLAAAEAIAGCVPAEALSEDYIIPSVFDRDVVPRVAKAVAAAARATGVARRRIRIDDDLR